jgi:hypothetical protein
MSKVPPGPGLVWESQSTMTKPMLVEIIPKYPCTIETKRAAKVAEELLNFHLKKLYEARIREVLYGERIPKRSWEE